MSAPSHPPTEPPTEGTLDDAPPSETMTEPGDETGAEVETEHEERRASGGRARARDRLMDRATQSYPRGEKLDAVDHIDNLLLFIDDDLRETALAVGRIEGYLIRTLSMLERPAITRKEVQALACDMDVLDHLDVLNETLQSLRRRLSKLGISLK